MLLRYQLITACKVNFRFERSLFCEHEALCGLVPSPCLVALIKLASDTDADAPSAGPLAKMHVLISRLLPQTCIRQSCLSAFRVQGSMGHRRTTTEACRQTPRSAAAQLPAEENLWTQPGAWKCTSTKQTQHMPRARSRGKLIESNPSLI